MKVFLIICLLVLPACLLSQENNRLRFGSMIHTGYHQGSSGAYFGVQAINGVHFRTWYMGVGTGIDYYYFRSVPLFLDIRKNLAKKPAAPFVYLDLGANVPWKKKEAVGQNGISYKPRIYYDLGIGYKTPVLKKFFLTMSAGYSEKQMKERYENWWGPNGHEEITYVFRKINLKVGLGF